MYKSKITRSTQISILAMAVLGGILIGREGWGIDVLWIPSLLLLALISLKLRSKLAFVLLVSVCLLVGVWRGNDTTLNKTQLGKLIGQKANLIGIVIDDPTRNDKGQLVFTLGSLSQDGRQIDGRVRVYTNYKKLQRGYHVQTEGKIVENLGSVRVRYTFAQVTVLDENIGTLNRFRQRMFASSRSAIPDSLAGFGLGLLIGVKGLIPTNLQETLTLVGLTHLIAVSGYNLTIIVQFVNRSLGSISTYLATATSVWLILGFILVTGFSASIIRAAFVAGLALAAQYYGHRIKPMTLIAIPAATTAAYNPDYLLHDLGWQLSFLAFFGILVLAPLFERRWFNRPNAVTSLFTQSISAQIMTFPLILLIFHNLSIVSPLANLLILPLVPLAMMMSFLTGLAGLISPILASWVALPTTGLLAIMVGLCQWIAAWPAANVKLLVTPGIIIAFYLGVGLLIFAIKRAKPDRESIVPSVLKDRVLA